MAGADQRPEHLREPCPDRILDDIGSAFSMGAVGGSAWHFIKGLKNSPKGERLAGGTQAVRINAPRIGGSFAVWGGLFSTFDCSMVYLRQKEDPWNSIAAGAATGGFLQLRQGLRSASRSAVFGGVLLAMIEGSVIMLNRLTASMANPPPIDEPLPQFTAITAGVGPVPQAPPFQAEQETNSWFGGLFGGNKEEQNAAASVEKFDSFESHPAPPTPGFDLK